MKMIKIFFTQEEINQLYQALDNIPSEIYSECDTPDDLDKELLSGIKKLKKETKDENDIKNVRFVEMTFDHTISFDIQEIADANNFVTNDIEAVECGKWAHLHITLKDGRIITEDGCTYGEVDMKWASEEHLYDENYGELI
jgi:hypothetical protein